VKTVGDLAMMPRDELKAAAGDALDASALDALVGEAAMTAVELGHAVMHKKLAKRQGGGDGSDAAFDDLFRVTCTCSCSSAASAQAYLAHLLRFTLQTVRYQGVAIDLGRLQSTFRQPLRDLPATCASSETMVAQVRIAVEVLRAHLRAAGNASATASPGWYLEAAYGELIQFLGLTYGELRDAFRLSDLASKAKFLFLNGLSVAADPGDGQLVDELFRDVAAAPPDTQALTEDWLQATFGLRSTLADPLAPDQSSPLALEMRRRVLSAQWARDDSSPARALGSRPIIDPHLVDEVDLVERVGPPLNDTVTTWRPIPSRPPQRQREAPV
jgi:hypothetical protein